MTTEDRLGLAAAGLGPSTVHRFKTTVALGSTGAAILAVAGLFGYVPGLRVLGSIRADYIPMAPSTAGCLLILSVALFVHARKPWQGAALKAMVALVLLVMVVGLLEAVEPLVGIDLDLEDRLVAGAGTMGGIPVGQMSPITGAVLIMAGLGTFLLLLRSWSSRRAQRAGHWASSLGALTMIVGATVLLAYLYGAPLMYTIATVPMALTTAVAFLCLGPALMAAAGPESFPVRLVIGDSTAARLSRVFLPLTVAAVLLENIIAHFDHLWLDVPDTLLTALLATFAGIITVAVVTHVAQSTGAGLDEISRKLRESAEWRGTILQTAMAGFLQVDTQGRVLEVNEAYCQMSGYNAQELLAMRVFDLEAAETAEQTAAHMQELTTRGRHEFESRHRRKDGSVYDVDVSAQYNPSHGGLIIAFVQDITERKLAELALRESESSLREAQEIARVGSYVLDVPRDVWSSSATLNTIFGIGADFPRTTAGWVQTIHPAEREALVSYTGAVFAAHGQFERDYRIVRQNDGAERWVFHRGKVEYGADGAPLRVVGTIQDITERKQAERELRTLSRALQQSPASVVITDRAGNIEYVNPRFEQITGYTVAEVAGRNPRLFQSGTTPIETYREMWKLIVEGGEWRGEMCNRRKNGELFWEYLAISGLKGEDGLIDHYIAVNDDITELRQITAERSALREQLTQSQKMESIGLLAGGVAHDFNNMLAAIFGYTELTMLKLGNGHAVYSHVEQIRKAAQRSADLTRQLLAFARKQTIAPMVLDLNAAIYDIREMLQRMLGEQVKFVWTPGSALWKVKADPTHIDQVLTNLAVNAKNAKKPERDVLLDVSTSNVVLDAAFVASHLGAHPGEFVHLRFSDNCCGMEASTLSRIFEPFFTTKAPGEGTGLGLSTVYGIMMQHGGFVDVESTPGVGTTFHLYFPRSHEVTEEIAVLDTPLRHGAETILLAEDDESVRASTAEMLRILGYTVLAAQSGEEAAALAASHTEPIDLLLTDVIMPEVNGAQLRDTLRKQRPDLRVLFMSGYAGNVISTEGVFEPGTHFIQKPFTMLALADAVRKVLDD